MHRRQMTPFKAILLTTPGQKITLPLPFDPGNVWVQDPHQTVTVLCAQLAARIVEAPLPWVFALGETAALLTRIAAERLDLRIAGASLIAPQDWAGAVDRQALSLAPLAFPVLVRCTRPGKSVLPSQRMMRFLQGWKAEVLPDPAADPAAFLRVTRAAMARRAAAMAPAVQAALAQDPANCRSDLPSSTCEIASRTSNIVSLTQHLASSGQSEHGT